MTTITPEGVAPGTTAAGAERPRFFFATVPRWDAGAVARRSFPVATGRQSGRDPGDETRRHHDPPDLGPHLIEHARLESIFACAHLAGRQVLLEGPAVLWRQRAEDVRAGVMCEAVSHAVTPLSSRASLSARRP